jgi:hypothetical protein
VVEGSLRALAHIVVGLLDDAVQAFCAFLVACFHQAVLFDPDLGGFLA